MHEDATPGTPLFPLSRYIHREIIVLVILTAVAVAAFLTTKASASAALRLRQRDAAAWHARGQADLGAGRVDEALDALGRARALDRDRADYSLSFAAALVEAGQPDAARQVLLGLREAHPEDPDVNLGLAQIEAAHGLPADAVRFYQSTLYGEWTGDRLDERRRVRSALVRYLLAHGMRNRATAHLLLLEADLPSDVPHQLEVAALLLEAGEPRRALAHFTAVLEKEPANVGAVAGAGFASFALGDYAAARRYFALAPASVDGVAEKRELSERVIALDPLQPRLRAAERRRRLASGHAEALALAASCAPMVSTPADVARLQTLEDALRTLEAALSARGPLDHDAIADGTAAVAAVAAFAGAHCGPLDADARAWTLIGGAGDGR
jgi:tetratricopeptide (TPR) repeat protein